MLFPSEPSSLRFLARRHRQSLTIFQGRCYSQDTAAQLFHVIRLGTFTLSSVFIFFPFSSSLGLSSSLPSSRGHRTLYFLSDFLWTTPVESSRHSPVIRH